MTEPQLTYRTAARRTYWVEEIRNLSGKFGDDAARLEDELTAEIGTDGGTALRDHLHTCGVIPESYDHDSSEEKLYSKYTDAVIAVAFRHLGISCAVLTERGDAADVEAVANGFDFVADAKAFRLSRTAKNQKDFKIQAMDGWKHGKEFAIVVCPIFQLPARSSQIYAQAATRNVCVLSFSHLVFLSLLAERKGKDAAESTLGCALRAVARMNPSKDAVTYWHTLNKEMLAVDGDAPKLWIAEKQAADAALALAKEEGLLHLAGERKKILMLSKEDAIRELLRVHRIDSRMATILAVADNGLLDLV